MKELARLSPAQTFLLIEGNSASQKDLLKYTFMDLLLKQVLKTLKQNYRPSKFDPVQVITYVHIGKNFSGYKPSDHENVFLLPFQKSRTLKVMFRHAVKMGYENSIGKHHYQRVIGNTFELAGCIKRNFFQEIFGGFALTGQGSELRKKLKDELDYLEEYLPPLITSNKQKAFEVLKLIKGNIFLLKNIDFTLIKEIDKELMEEMYPTQGSGDSGCSGCVSTWDTFGHDWHTFDSSCSSGDSGCGGSGCSGCSGCGGCGGGD